MDIARIDLAATQGRSVLHEMGSLPKLVAFAIVLASVIVSVNLLVVVGIALTLLGVAVAMRLPMRLSMSLATYPAVFAALFALAAAPDVLTGLLIVAKAVTAAAAAVVLLLTTPYPQVFAPIQRFLPAVLADALLMTYRSLFLLVDKYSHTLTAARLRAGIVGARPIRSARVMVQSLGSVLLYSIDLSQRTYDVMHLRGYDGRLRVTTHVGGTPVTRAVVLGGAAAVAAIAIVWRVGAVALAPYAWLPAAAGLALVSAVSLYRVATRTRSS